MIIIVALLIWIGTELSAPWWYYGLLGIVALGRFMKTSFEIWKDANYGS